jgi:hypothetical protein
MAVLMMRTMRATKPLGRGMHANRPDVENSSLVSVDLRELRGRVEAPNSAVWR